MSDTLASTTPSSDCTPDRHLSNAKARQSCNPDQQGLSRRHLSVDLGHARVGYGSRAPVIAEAGVNHNGDVDCALRMIDAAAEVGADFVKFQAFRADELVTKNAKLAQYQEGAVTADSQHAMLEALELDRRAFAGLKQRCDDIGIGFLATPFGVNDLKMLVDIGATAIKVASTDLDNWLLLDACAASGLPAILSTGASLGHEVGSTVRRMRQLGCDERLVLLHCVSAYPTQWNQLNLRRIESLAHAHKLPVGFSDHTTSVDAGAIAVAAGACILEKHFTLNRTLPGPDHASSLEPNQFTQYIKRVREIEASLGDGALDMQANEADVRQAARKSIIASCDIESGAVIRRDMISTKRPGGGISPSMLDELLGATVCDRIAAGQAIQWSMIKL